jgi:predicted transcriptional regulator
MATVTIGIASLDETTSRMHRAFDGEAQGAFISFPSVELLWKVITPRRWEMLRVLAGSGPMAIRALARRIGRDVKTVHGDVQALLGAGVMDRTKDGLVVFPYDAVHVDFVLPVGQSTMASG